MVSTQRSYQLESSAIQTENQMLSIANQLVTHEQPARHRVSHRGPADDPAACRSPARHARRPSVREGSATVKQAYANAQGFEEMLLQQLSQSLVQSSGLGGESEAGGEGSSGEEGASLGGESSGMLSSLLPQTLTEGVMRQGGLGLATQLMTRSTRPPRAPLDERSAGTTGATAAPAAGTTGSQPRRLRRRARPVPLPRRSRPPRQADRGCGGMSAGAPLVVLPEALDQDGLLSADVLNHLEAQIASAQRLLEIVLDQGAAIRARDVHTVVRLAGLLHGELTRRQQIENERSLLLARAGARWGSPPSSSR